jgi:DNA-binding response OmpR family regulator
MAQSNRTILMADNRPEYLNTVKEFFEVEGYAVRTAGNPTEARRVLETEPPDLAILDLRLLDNDDEKDISGLEVAMDTAPGVPKIILTDFPNWQTVRAALGPTDNGGPPAVDYVAKSEGPEALLRAVRLTLLSLSPEFEKNLLQAFKVPATVALRNRLNVVGAEGAAARLREAYEDTSTEMRAHRERESARASRLHMWGLAASLVGIALIFAAVALFIAGAGAGVAVTLAGGAVSKAVGVLFSWREDAAHKRAASYYGKLDELSRADKILAICESLESPEERDEYKKKVINSLLSGK